MNNYLAYELFFKHQKKTKDAFELILNYKEDDIERNISVMNNWKEESTNMVQLLKKSDLSVFAKTTERALIEFQNSIDTIEKEGQIFFILTSYAHLFIIDSSKLDNCILISRLVLELHDECFQILTSKIHPTPSIQLKKFPSYITETLMGFFTKSFFPTPEQIRELSKNTNLTEIQIQNWFKNRRKRDKKFLIPLSFPSKNLLLSNPHIHSYIPNYDDQIINVSSSIRELSLSEDDQNDWEKLFYSNK